MQRLVFMTQSVDPAHPALAATIPKIRALAARADEVVVLAQSGAGDGLPANVELRSFGASSRPGRVWHFEREVSRALPADAVVAHMIPAYVVLAAPLVRARRTPLLLWYTHWRASRMLRAAERLATAVVSVDRRSFPLDSAKVHAIGHGIDVNEFTCTRRATGVPVSTHWCSAATRRQRGSTTILRAVEQVDGVEVELHGAALNELEQRHREELERLGHELGDAVPRAQVPELFARTDVLVNNMRAGAPDKVVYEAAAACLPVLASNPVFDELFEGYLAVLRPRLTREPRRAPALVRRARRRRAGRDRPHVARARRQAPFR